MLFHPDFDPANFILYDQSVYQSCCLNSNFCHLYREFRPVDTCVNYAPPAICEYDKLWSPAFIFLALCKALMGCVFDTQ